MPINVAKSRFLGTEVSIYVDTEKEDIIFNKIFHRFSVFENKFSRFKKKSELSILNNSANEKNYVSQELFDLIKFGKELSQVFNGIFDISIGTSLVNIGYKNNFEAGKHSQINNVFDIYTHNDIFLNQDDNSVIKPKGLKIDFGGFGKGLIVDEIFQSYQHEYKVFAINAGGDIKFNSNGKKPWLIDIIHPIDGIKYHYLENHFGAFCSSGTTKRKWKNKKEIHHHLIDPLTGKSMDTDILSCSVFSKSTCLSEVVAKVIISYGLDKGIKFAKEYEGIEAYIVTADKISVTNPKIFKPKKGC
jgi:thiamine biosynthesis lipoprotein